MSGILQNYLVFILLNKYFKFFSGTTKIYSWKSNGMSEKSLGNITTADQNFAPTWISSYPLPDIKFNRHYLINKLPDSRKVRNLYISYTLDPWSRDLNTDFTLNNCLFGSVKLTENSYPDKEKYSNYGLGFDSRSEFSLTDGSVGKNVIIFGSDMSSFVPVDNKNKDVLIGEGPTQGLDDTELTAEYKYPINFTQSGKRFVLNLHYNGSNSFSFVNATKTY